MSSHREPIAIVGLSCRFPGAPDPSAFWDLLTRGGDAVIAIPPGRWNLDALQRFNDGEPLPYNATHGGWLPDVRQFDHTFFRMSPREARTLDPKQRLALEVVHEAFEDANLAPLLLRRTHTVGMFLGTAQSEYLMRFYNRMEVGSSRADRYSGPGNDVSFSAGRISAMFGLEGPSVNVNTACSTSLVAVHQAVRALQDGECDIAAAGGVSIIHSPEHSLVMDKFGVLSPDSKCKAFDASADGYVRAEGCGIVILRRLSDALAAGDRIDAVLLGSAVNHNGLSDNLMAPDAAAQVRLLRAAVKDAAIDPGTVDVVEAHGTGTSLGDPIEVSALADVFGAARGARPPIRVASVKTNIGHLEVAAGIAGLIKAVLSLRHAAVPAHLHLRTLNPAISPTLPLRFPTQTEAWPAPADHPRRIAVNSFGISGINAAAILEAPPRADAPGTLPPRPVHTLPLSAYGDVPLRALAAAYAQRLAKGASLSDLATTAATGRDAHPTRAAVVAADSTAARAALDALAAGQPHDALRTGDARSARPRVAFLFTGQGAQHVGMGRAAYLREPAFAAALDDADRALLPHLGRSIRAVMFGDDTSVSLDDTAWTQPALFALEHATASLWRAWGVQPDVMVGHSIGEIAAAVHADILSLDDAAALVAARGKLMQALPRDGAMAALFADVTTVRTALSGRPGVDVAADNGPKSTVISGRADVVESLRQAFDAQGLGTRTLAVSHAFHSPLMEPMLDAFADVVARLRFSPATRRIVSTVTAAADDATLSTPDYWVRHVRATVRFREAMLALKAEGVTLVLEVGPEATLIGMGRRCVMDLPATWLASASRERPDHTFAEALAGLYVGGAPLDWLAVHDGRAHTRVPLPAYPFQRKEHFVEDPGPGIPAVDVPAGAIAGLRAPAQVAAPAPVASTSGPRTFTQADFYRTRWVPLAAAPTPGAATATGTWIVTPDARGVLRPLVDGLRADGHTVVEVEDTSDPVALRALVATHAATLRGWVYGGALDAGARDDVDGAWWSATQSAPAVGALHVFQAVLSAPARVPVWTVTAGADAVCVGESPALGQGGPWGVARVVALEHRDLPNLRVDLDPASPASGVATLLDWVRRTPADEDQLALRRGQAYALRVVAHTPSGERLRPRPVGAWIITGGLGALGLAVAAGLVEAGATHLVLCGRSAPTDDARTTLTALIARGVTVDVEAVDVADAAQVSGLFARLDARRVPVHGVVHAAGVLADGPVLATDADRFRRVYGAKVAGAWNLHVATRSRALDAFVLFSSVTSILGAPGQVNYAGANVFLDALAHHRHALGLPAVSVNWGPWGQIGMAARLSELMAARGMGGVPTAAGVDATLRCAEDLAPQVAFMDLRVHTLLAQDPAFARAPLMRELVRGLTPAPAVAPTPASATPTTAAPVATPAVVAGDAVAALRAVPPSERPAVAARHVATLVEGLLGVDPGSLSTSRPLSWQGFDSVMAVDLNAALARTFGTKLPQDAVTVGPSVDELASRLLDTLALPADVVARTAVPVAVVTPAPTPAPTGDLLATLVAWTESLLGFQPGELDPARPLAWQGFDSVMATDLYKRVRDGFGVAPPLDRFVSGPRLTELADELRALGASAPSPTTPAPVAATIPTAAPVTATASTELLAWLVTTTEGLLGFQPGELDPARPLAWQGFDSVMATDLYKRLRDALGTSVPLDRLVAGPRLTELAAELAALGAQPPRATAAAPVVAATIAPPPAAAPVATVPSPAPPVVSPTPDAPAPPPSDTTSMVMLVLVVILSVIGLAWYASGSLMMPAGKGAQAPATDAPAVEKPARRRGGGR